MVPPRNTTAEEGSRVRLECQAAGYPDNVSVHWSFDGQAVGAVGHLQRPTRRVHVLADGALVIDAVTPRDTGWYRCRPTNRLGAAPEADAFLNVTCECTCSVAEWLACWTECRAQKGPADSNRSCDVLRQTVHTHRASVHQAAKLVAAWGRAGFSWWEAWGPA